MKIPITADFKHLGIADSFMKAVKEKEKMPNSMHLVNPSVEALAGGQVCFKAVRGYAEDEGITSEQSLRKLGT